MFLFYNRYVGEKLMKKIAKIFIIIQMVVRFPTIVPFVLGLIVLKKLESKLDKKERLAWSIVTLIFVSLVAGILLLVDQQDETEVKEEKTVEEKTKKHKEYDYLIETHDLVKKYGKHVVIDKVNMHIKEGQIYGFVDEIPKRE